ncbi:MAG TPA: NAD(P)H-dependent glycerol-3-phosphate dehydrogenase [Verrucomicrobiae bacterium]|nr:NAD(P)H-dependent glycerol-3-phosphate dehydrogenase [Verrucomicrobiae bacterium]
MNVTVLGAGSWGTALARLLALNAHTVTLWGHNAAHVAEIRRVGCNERYLPGARLPENCRLSADFDEAAGSAEAVIIAVPSKVFRAVTSLLPQRATPLVSVTKGIEGETGLTMCGILREVVASARVATLSGPSLAEEVAREVPTAVVAASPDEPTALLVQQLFHRPAFRVYTSCDLLGVELGGALKNVIAIAAGVCDGLKFGDNSKAALVTRAISEIGRLGVAAGAKAETFSGLGGLGDLVVTCFSNLSRNHTLGKRLGSGENLAEIVATMTSVAEGYPTARSAVMLARKLNVETPIIDQVYAMLYEGKNPARAVRDLMARDSKPEM